MVSDLDATVSSALGLQVPMNIKDTFCFPLIIPAGLSATLLNFIICLWYFTDIVKCFFFYTVSLY